MTISQILEELNLENGSNYKLKVLEKYKDNDLLQRVLKQCYDRVTFSFGVTMKNVKAGISKNKESLEWGLEQLEKLANREFTGNAAIDLVKNVLESMSKEDREVIKLILGRDLKINMGTTSINKVFKGLIPKPCYERCDIYNEKTAKNIKFPAFIQLKADGTYRETKVKDGEITFLSRSGETYTYPTFDNTFKECPNGHYFGELTVRADRDLMARVLPKIEKADKANNTNTADKIKEEYKEALFNDKEYIFPRSIGNGLINSDDVPYDNIIYELWDYVTLEDYQLAALKDKKNPPKIPYKNRFNKLLMIVAKLDNHNIRIIDFRIVKNLEEASNYTANKMKEGLEGSVLKDPRMLYKNGTSNEQLKMKVSFDLEVRCIGFIEGTPGTKREKTFGSLVYETDDGLIKGSVSGFKDSELKEINNNRQNYIGKIFTIEGNDLTKARGSDHFAISHPRFIEFRDDRNDTDTLERAQKSLDSAKMFKKNS